MIPNRRFMDLFQGNPDAYGMDVDGGVVAVRKPAAEGIINHLHGVESVGIYPMWRNRVHWGCTDIDTGSWDEAQTMWKILDRMDLYPCIEISRSKGYHVWSFASGWVDARIVRRAFLFAHYVSRQIHTPVAEKEVNPKSEGFTDEELAKGKLGNFVRLPYVGGEADENGRRTMLDPHTGAPVSLTEFVQECRTVSLSVYQQWADKYRPPTDRWREPGRLPDEAASEIASKLNPKGQLIFREGLPDWSHDRSKCMAKLAIECCVSGLEVEEAFVVVNDLNERLGKWSDPKYVWSAVEWGYTHA